MNGQLFFRVPRNKPSVYWFLVGLYVLLLLIILYQLFRPSPRIVVSHQTTVIAGPLEPDGLPNYEAHVLGKMREGVSPESNAAALLWPAVWPGELDRIDWGAIAGELGLEEIPSPEDALVPVDKFIQAEYRRREPPVLKKDAPAYDPTDKADKLFTQVHKHTWRESQYPWLARWVKENKAPLDMIVAGSRRPRCYIPSPSLLDQPVDPLMVVLLPGVHSIRVCGPALSARAMLHLGEHRHAEAWDDLLAIHRIGRLVAQDPILMTQFVGISIDGIACECTPILLASDGLTADQARQIERDLRVLPYFAGFADSLDSFERLMFASNVIDFKRGRLLSEDIGYWDNNILEDIQFIRSLNINWNFILFKGNEFYDEYVKAARLPTFEARLTASQQLDTKLDRLSKISVGRILSSSLSSSVRNETVAAIFFGLFITPLQEIESIEYRANSRLDLLRLAAALAVYRAEQGHYPEKLDELVPGVVEKLPVDLYHAKPFVYTKTKDGYLLYTLGENGIDEGGSHEKDGVLEGNSADEMEGTAAEAATQKIPKGADDLSIRVPRLVAKPIVLPPEPIAIPAAPNVPDTR